MKLAEFKDEYEKANREDFVKFNQRKLDCALYSRNMIIVGMITGGLGSHAIMTMLSNKYTLFRNPNGRGLLVGAIGTLTGYFLSRYNYENCVQKFVVAMRHNARFRHEHYFTQLTGQEAWRDPDI